MVLNGTAEWGRSSAHRVSAPAPPLFFPVFPPERFIFRRFFIIMEYDVFNLLFFLGGGDEKIDIGSPVLNCEKIFDI